LARFSLTTALFTAGIIIGSLLWNRISLPFENPWGVTGLFTLIQYNPANNILRFIVFIISPFFLLSIFYLLSRGRLRESTFPAPAAETPAAAQKGVLAFLVLMLFSVIVALNYPERGLYERVDTFHEGESLGTAVSHEAGLVPYKDFIFVHGAYQDPLRSIAAFKLFGRSIGAVRAFENLHELAAFVLLGLMSWRLFAGSFVFAFSALLISAVYIFVEPVPEFMPSLILWRESLAFLFVLAALSLNARMRRGEKGGAGLFAAGFFFSFIPIASFACSIDKAFYITATFIALSPLLYFFSFRGCRTFLASIAVGAAAGAAVLVAVLGEGAGAFFEYVFLRLPRYKELMDGLVYPFKTPSAYLFLVLMAFNLFWIGMRFLREIGARGALGAGAFFRGNLIELTLLLLSIFMMRSALGRADLPHIAYSACFTYLLSLYLLFTGPGIRLFARPAFRQAVNRGSAALAALLIAFGIYRIQSQDLLNRNFPYHVSDSELIPPNYKAAISFLKENLGPNEHFFTMTSEAAWYYFVNRPSPTRFPVVWFAMPRFYQQEIIEDLEEKRVKYIIMSNSNWSNKIDKISSKSRLPIVRDYIYANYTVLGMIDDHEIWVRKGAGPPTSSTNGL